MKENIKIIFACFITLVLSSIISISADIILEANKVSYKTSNGDNVDVNSALDRLFNAVDINTRLGDADISTIGDGTITGAVNTLNANLSSTGTVKYNPADDYIYLLDTNNNWIKWRKSLLSRAVLIENGVSIAPYTTTNNPSINSSLGYLIINNTSGSSFTNFEVNLTNYSKIVFNGYASTQYISVCVDNTNACTKVDQSISTKEYSVASYDGNHTIFLYVYSGELRLTDLYLE